jgi:hypothetical protein
VYRPLQFDERSQHFVGTHDKTLSVAMRVHNPDRSPFKIDSGDSAQAPSGFAEIVGNDFPILHSMPCGITGYIYG